MCSLALPEVPSRASHLDVGCSVGAHVQAPDESHGGLRQLEERREHEVGDGPGIRGLREKEGEQGPEWPGRQRAGRELGQYREQGAGLFPTRGCSPWDVKKLRVGASRGIGRG